MPTLGTRWSRWAIAGVIVSVMALMGLGGLALSLNTVANRRADDLHLLGYLPDGTNIVGAIHVAKLMDEPLGRRLLDDCGLGSDHIDFAWLEKALGIRREQIADVLFGSRAKNASTMPWTIVVQLLTPYPNTEYWNRVHEQRPVIRNGKRLYRLDSNALAGFVWCATERTLVLSSAAEVLDSIPLEGRSGVAHLPAAVQSFHGDRESGQAQVWLVGHPEHWNQLGLAPQFRSMLGADSAAWEKVKTAGAWIHVTQAISASAACHCDSNADAQELLDVLRRRGVDEKGRLQSDGNGWLSFHTQCDLAHLVRWGSGRW